MQVDRYTKIVLTLIAVALLYLCVVQTIRPESVRANSELTVPVFTDSNGQAVVPVVEVRKQIVKDPHFPTSHWVFVQPTD
ncbi:MAG TPA: hypothetical protein VHA33_19680 [Candidatus Angelobacter sp.]|jgi:hypothetical protein|nr:hypothetical protein [Candidatus Angelobacter sp.]